MFDGIKYIFRGFGGQYQDSPEGRKLIWAHIVVGVFAFCTLLFTAYVSFSRYQDLVGTLLARSFEVALLFTSAIALFMLSASTYVAVFLIQAWVRERDQQELRWQGALIFGLAAILVGIIDFNMNLDGAHDLSIRAAGTVSTVDENAILQRYANQIQPLKAQQDSILQIYTWKGVTYFKPTKYHPQAEYEQDKARFDALAQQISRLRDAQNTALASAQSDYRHATQQRDQRQSKTFQRLSIAVKYVYFLQFILALVGAYISHVLSQDQLPGPLIPLPDHITRPRLHRPTRPQPSGAATTPVAQTTHQLVHQIPTQRLPQSPIGYPINTPLNTQFLGADPIQQAQASGQVSEADIAFLSKYRLVVKAILRGDTYRQITDAHHISKSTAQNVKRVMKAVRLLE